MLLNRAGTGACGGILGPWRSHVHAALRLSNTRCGFAASLVIGLAASASPARGQVGNAQAMFDSAALPDAGDVVAAHSAVRSWVNQLQAPKLDEPEARVKIRDCAGVCVIIRRVGKPIGTGIDCSGDDLMARRAAGRALNQALGDAALSSVAAQLQEIAGGDRSELALGQAIRADLGGRLTLDIEAAGKMLPLPGRDLSQLARKLVPGLDGVAVRRGADWSVLFPAQLRTINKTADTEKLLLYLCIQGGVPMKAVSQLDTLDDVAFYRFRTIHLGQVAPQRAPVNLVRGNTFARLGEDAVESTQEFAGDLVGHLLQRVHLVKPSELEQGESSKPTSADLAGDYLPWIDQFAGPATAFEQALVCWGLWSYCDLPGGDAAVRAQCAEAAGLLMASPPMRDAVAANDPLASAAIIYAVSANPKSLELDEIRQIAGGAAACLGATFEPGRGFLQRSVDESHPRALDAHAQSIIAGALARLLTLPHVNPPENDTSRVRLALDAAWRSAAEPEQVALLPWIGWGEIDWATAAHENSPRLDDLRRLMATLEDSRLGSAQMPAPQDERDLLGGFALRRSHQDLLDLTRPTSQTVRPAAWLATALRQPELVATPQRQGAMEGHLDTIRFLRQLSIRDDGAALLPNSRRARGGLRDSLWDLTQPLPAQALTLIACFETLRSLDAGKN